MGLSLRDNTTCGCLEETLHVTLRDNTCDSCHALAVTASAWLESHVTLSLRDNTESHVCDSSHALAVTCIVSERQPHVYCLVLSLRDNTHVVVSQRPYVLSLRDNHMCIVSCCL